MKYRTGCGLWLTLVLATGESRSENWPGWRGPTADGVSREIDLPTAWSQADNVEWKVEVPGIGHSSPIVWDDRVYVTSATGSGGETKWWVFCFDRNDGKLVWRTEAAAGRGERAHGKHGRASSTPYTDGEHVWAYFGNGGVACLDRDGNVAWRRELRKYQNPWGSAASVVIFDDRVIINGDDDADPFLVALDKGTGETLWKTPREGQARSFSTPAVVPVPGTDRFEVVINGQHRVKGYDLKTGEELWTVEGATQWVTPTPVFSDGLVFASSGRSGPTFAIRPGGKGDVTTSHVAWKIPTGSPYISSPVLWDRFLFMVNGTGIATCLDAKTGKVFWRERFQSGKDGFSNSPIAANGIFYVMDEEGSCSLLRASETYERIATNSIGERCLTSPAASDGQIFLRSDRHLYCIGSRQKNTDQ